MKTEPYDPEKHGDGYSVMVPMHVEPPRGSMIRVHSPSGSSPWFPNENWERNFGYPSFMGISSATVSTCNADPIDEPPKETRQMRRKRERQAAKASRAQRKPHG